MVDCEPRAILLEPIPDITVLVIRRIILDPKNRPRKIGARHALPISQIALSIEDLGHLVEELPGEHIHRTEHFDGFVLTSHRDFRLMTTTCPGPVQCRVLAKTGFVTVDQCRPKSSGFF
jgi:hypothetical protein